MWDECEIKPCASPPILTVHACIGGENSPIQIAAQFIVVSRNYGNSGIYVCWVLKNLKYRIFRIDVEFCHPRTHCFVCRLVSSIKLPSSVPLWLWCGDVAESGTHQMNGQIVNRESFLVTDNMSYHLDITRQLGPPFSIILDFRCTWPIFM